MRSIIAAVTCLTVPLPASAQATPPTVVISFPVFAQTVAFPYPFADTAYGPDYEAMSPDNRQFISERVPEGETLENWSQMVTVIAQRDAAAGLQGDALAQLIDARLMQLYAQYAGGCVTPPVAFMIEAPVPSGLRAAKAALLTCPSYTHPSLGQIGEAMVFVVGAGSRDLYDLQLAQRYPPGIENFNAISREIWLARAQALAGGSRFCGPAPGETRPPAICN